MKHRVPLFLPQLPGCEIATFSVMQPTGAGKYPRGLSYHLTCVHLVYSLLTLPSFSLCETTGETHSPGLEPSSTENRTAADPWREKFQKDLLNKLFPELSFDQAKSKMGEIVKELEKEPEASEPLTNKKLDDLESKLKKAFGGEFGADRSSPLLNYVGNFLNGGRTREILEGFLNAQTGTLGSMAYDRKIAPEESEKRRIIDWAIQKRIRAQLEKDKDFQGQFRGEADSGVFLMTAENMDQKELIQALLEEPGTRIKVLASQSYLTPSGAETLKKMHVGSLPKEMQDRIDFVPTGSGLLGRWTTDYVSIPTIDQNGKPVYLDAEYFPGHSRSAEDFAPIVLANVLGETPPQPFPVAIEGGNISLIKGQDGKSYSVVSDEVIKLNKQLLGLPSDLTQEVVKKYLGQNLVIVPAQNDGTGHTDMQFFTSQKNGKTTAFVPTITPESSVEPMASRSLEKFLSGASGNAKPFLSGSVQAGMALRLDIIDSISSNAKFDRTAGILSNLVGPENVKRIPIIPPVGTDTTKYANAVYSPNVVQFKNASGQNILVAPEFPKAAGNDSYKKKFQEIVSPHFDKIKWVPSESLYGMCGGPHCVSPQIYPQPK
jgi:hypothetical protein